jgi:hypothetical protein
MDPDGILKACTTNTRMANANNIATMIASAYSRTMDLRPAWSALSVTLAPVMDAGSPGLDPPDNLSALR